MARGVGQREDAVNSLTGLGTALDDGAAFCLHAGSRQFGAGEAELAATRIRL